MTVTTIDKDAEALTLTLIADFAAPVEAVGEIRAAASAVRVRSARAANPSGERSVSRSSWPRTPISVAASGSSVQ